MRFLSALLVLSLLLPAAAHAEEGCKTVVTVYGEAICEADILPDATLEKQVRAYTEMNGEDPDDAIEGIAKTNLLSAIWEEALINRYGADAITPTKKEKESYLAALRKSVKKQYAYDKEIAELLKTLVKENTYNQENMAKLNQIGMQKQQAIMLYEMRDKMPPEMKDQVDKGERDVADSMVKSWKVKKVLYEEYGGRVTFQQSGLEPVEAIGKFLTDLKQSKQVVFVDKSYKDVFEAMEDYLEEDHEYLPVNSVEVREYFASPTWIYDSNIGDEAQAKIKEALLALPHGKAAPPAKEDPKKEKKE